jgi:predicted DNA-binding transcriptional regulator AlpA
MIEKNQIGRQTWFTAKQVASRFSVSPGTVWRWVSEEKFPKPVMLSRRTPRWSETALIKFERSATHRDRRTQKSERAI